MTVILCVICFYNILTCTAADHLHVMAMRRSETWPDFHISDSHWIQRGNGFDFSLQWYDSEKR